MGIARGDAVAVVDFDHVAVAARSCPAVITVPGAVATIRVPLGARKSMPACSASRPRKGIEAVAEAAGDVAGRRRVVERQSFVPGCERVRAWQAPCRAQRGSCRRPRPFPVRRRGRRWRLVFRDGSQRPCGASSATLTPVRATMSSMVSVASRCPCRQASECECFCSCSISLSESVTLENSRSARSDVVSRRRWQIAAHRRAPVFCSAGSCRRCPSAARSP